MSIFNFRKLLKSESGFSLAEVMVAAGMVGVVSLAVTQLMQNMSKGSKKLQQDSEVSSIEQRIAQNMRKQSNCTASLRGTALAFGASIPITDLYMVKPTWVRSNAGDVAANKNVFAHASLVDPTSIYGAGGSRVRLAEMSIAGFHNGGPMGDLGSYDGASIQQTYTFAGDGGATDGGANTVRNQGDIVLRVSFQRSVSVNVAAGNTAQEVSDAHKAKSYGAETTVKFIPLRVVTNGAGIIQECYGDNSNYVEASCDSLDGTIDSGDCKNLKVKNVAADAAGAALTVEGNLQVDPDPSNPAHASDKGSVGIGLAANTGTTSNLDVAGSVGIGTASTGTSGDLNVNRSVGIGVGANGTAGDLGVNNSVGVGMPANGTAGDVSINNDVFIGHNATVTNNVNIQNSLGVGTTAPGTPGAGHFTNSVAVGSTTPSGTPGDFYASNRVGVGIVNGGAAGSLRVNNSVGVGKAASGTSGDIDINNNARIVRSASIGGVAPSGIAGDLNVARYINVASNSGGVSIQVNKLIRTSASISEIDNSAKNFVTQEWVNNHVGQALAPAGVVSAVVGYIDSMSVSQGYEAIKKAICNSLRINGKGTGGTSGTTGCNITGYNSIKTMAWTSSTYELKIEEEGGGVKTTYVYNCSKSGKCYHLYASGNAYVSGSGSFGGNVTASGYIRANSYVKGLKFCIGSDCRTSFATRKCGHRQVVVAIGRGGGVGCAADAW